MKYGVREICDVVLKAKARTKIGNKTFFKNEPVIYFDTLKTSSLEGASTTVYAQGGPGNSRLVAWEGERTVTFTMEDALISPEGFMILSGAGLTEANTTKPVYQHIVETTSDFKVEGEKLIVYVSNDPFLPSDKKDNFAYVMLSDNGELASEPFIPVHDQTPGDNGTYGAHEPEGADSAYAGKYEIIVDAHDCYTALPSEGESYDPTDVVATFKNADAVTVDYYVARKSSAQDINITPDKFGGNYYLEASTLFRDENGVDHPAEFVIPNCKIQSNFTFTMASSGDPSTFTFTMDAFPDYTKFNKEEKVLAQLQIMDMAEGDDLDVHREATNTVKPHKNKA